MVAPPMPFLPPEAHGKLIVMGMLVYAGDPAAGEKVTAPFRALAEPIAAMLRPMAYPEIYPEEPEGYHPAAAAYSGFMDTVGPREAEIIVERLRASTAMMGVAQLRVLGGAMARVPADATAFGHRTRRIMVNIAALVESPDQVAAQQGWVDGFAAALAQGAPDVYVNFLGDEGAARVRQAYPGGTWDRLRDIKAKYDPGNLFRHNHNIPPAGAS
jgi:FAD/FMN-containing dehydrogenase